MSQTTKEYMERGLSKEAQLELALEATAIFFSSVLQAMHDRLGREEALRSLMPYMKQIGMAGLKDNTSRLGIGIDINGVQASFAYFLGGIGGKGEVLERSNERIVAEVTQCPFSGSPEICEIVEIAGMLGADELAPDVEITYEGIMTKGSPRCRVVFSKRKPESLIKSL